MRTLHLRPRDLNILKYIGSQSFATASEIHAKFFKGYENSGYHYKRLLRLEQKSLIDRLHGAGNHSLGYVLASKGFQILNEDDPNELEFSLKKNCYKGTYKHDFLVHKIKNIFLTSPIVSNFISENKIASRLLKSTTVKSQYQRGDKIPDGLFTLNVSGTPQLVALEVELSLKSKARYEKIFTKHSITNNWDTVFYVVKNVTIKNKLMSYLKQTKEKKFLVRTEENRNDVYFVLLDDVLQKKLSAPFVDEEIEFSLQSLEQSSGQNKSLIT